MIFAPHVFNLIKSYLHMFLKPVFSAVAPHCRTKIQGVGLDPHPGGGDGWVRDQGVETGRFRDQGVEMGGFRDQGVETGRFRYM